MMRVTGWQEKSCSGHRGLAHAAGPILVRIYHMRMVGRVAGNVNVKRPVEVLQAGVESLVPYLQASGELHDVVFGEPTQYGTPYHAFGHAVLARYGPEERCDVHSEQAVRGLRAALAHVSDPSLPATLSSFRRDGLGASRTNHRDFFWPPILKSYLILRELGVPEADDLARQIAAVDVLASFASRPPSNWSAVWLSGEWLRMRSGLSPFTLEQFDAWLDPFFATHLDLEKGFYHEGGHPNSYDLFTRVHLSDILLAGYDGRHRADLERLMETGFRRSLGVQLSDGSLASAHRSTGQTWTLGAQCAYFTNVANFYADTDPVRADEARRAAWRALASLQRWQRTDGPFSPVENCLPPAYRVGYEGYTADAHYSSLALGFLASAVRSGFGASPCPQDLARPDGVLIEGDPTYRALVHRGPYSVHLNAFPARNYDAFGLVDLTFGPGRWFHFVSSVRRMDSGQRLNIGMACRSEEGRTGNLDVLCGYDFALVDGLRRGDEPFSLVLEGRAKGAHYTFRMAVSIDDKGVHVDERTPGRTDYKSLLIPYLKDPGTGTQTQVEAGPSGVRFRHGDEVAAVTWDAEASFLLDLPMGFENRRGLCGLLRVDFPARREGIAYTVRIVE